MLTGPGYGPLPPMVLLHGLSSAAVHLGPLMRRLRPFCRHVVAVDGPGHGYSPEHGARPLTGELYYRAISEALDGLATGPMVLFGNSLGGAVALKYAAERPDRVASLVVMSPAGAPLEPDRLTQYQSQFRIQSHAQARAFLARVYHRRPWYLPFMASDVVRRFDTKAVRDLLRSPPSDQLRASDMERLSMPVLLLWGRSDRVVLDSHRRWFERHLPAHAVLERPEGWGHSAYLEHVDAVAQRIALFAASTFRAHARQAG